jgi:hypothetical protein
MSLSGITILDETRDGIINSALRKIGAISLGQTATTQEFTNATEALNNLVAEYQTLGMPLWARLQYNLPMVVNQSQYVIGVGQAVNIAMPLKILQAWTIPNTGGSIQELWPNSIDIYNRLPKNPAGPGNPSQYTYQPQIDQGTFSIWPAPDANTVTNRLLWISYISAFQVFNSSTYNPYFPREFNNALIYGLCDLLAPEYGVPLEDRGMFKKEKMEHLELALDFGLENASWTFQPMENWSHGA